MFSSNRALKVSVLVFLYLCYLFYSQFWLNGAFAVKGVEQQITTSPLENVTLTVLPELTTSELFGVFNKEEAPADNNEQMEQIFESAGQEFKGQLDNYQFLLYATADFGGELTAKLLSKNLEPAEGESAAVEVTTVRINDSIANAVVTTIGLSSIKLTSGEQQLTLKLFSKITPQQPELEPDSGESIS